MDVVGRVACDVGGQASNKVPVLHRIARYGGRRSQRVAGEKAADVDLLGPGKLDLVIAIAGHEMVLRTEIVVETRHVKIARNGRIQRARKSQDIRRVAQALAAS